jgi:4a-hydroxytetrahydrobiopterin dehydratase
MAKLTTKQIDAAMKDLPEWANTGDAVQRTLQFKDFKDAMAFVNRLADAAEAAQHHPDLLIRYNKVTLTLSTHDAGGITKKDFELARKIDAMLSAT